MLLFVMYVVPKWATTYRNMQSEVNSMESELFVPGVMP